MKLSITPISFGPELRPGNMTMRELIEYSAEQGLDGIDLLDPDMYPWAWDTGVDIAGCRRMLEDAGLKVAAFACGNNFAKTDPKERQEQIGFVQRSIERAAEAGVSCLRVFGGHLETSKMTADKALPMVVDGLGACIDKAEQHGVVLALENHGRMPGTAAEISRILREVGSRWLQVTFDAGNFQSNNMVADEDPVAAYHALRENIAHVHFKDVREPQIDKSRRREPCITGQGITPVKEIAQLLEQDAYPGYCSLEFEAGLCGDVKAGVTASLDYLKSLRNGGPAKTQDSQP